jgi:SulP family sulfate permease
VVVSAAVALVLVSAGAAASWLPRAVLAAIIVVAAAQLVDVRGIRRVFECRRSDGIGALATAAATLGLGLGPGLAVGVLLALTTFVVRTVRPHSAELGRLPGTTVWRNVERFDTVVCPQAGILRIDAPIYYANARFLEDRIHAMFADRPAMKLLVLDCAAVNDIDSTGVQSLERIVADLRERGNELHLVGPIGPVRDVLEHSGLVGLLGVDRIHRTIAEAAPTILAAVDRGYCTHRCTVAAFSPCSAIARVAAPSPAAAPARFMPPI